MGALIVRGVAVHGMREEMVPVAGIEPATFGLQIPSRDWWKSSETYPKPAEICGFRLYCASRRREQAKKLATTGAKVGRLMPHVSIGFRE